MLEYDEAISSGENFSLFGENISSVEDIKSMNGEDILLAFDTISADSQNNLSPKDMLDHISLVQRMKPTGGATYWIWVLKKEGYS